MVLKMSNPEIKACCLWLTGLSGAGKTTLGSMLVEHLAAEGRMVFALDGDILRAGLCKDLGFSAEDRSENIRRAAEVVRMFVDAGFVVIASFISPFAVDREVAKDIVGRDRFYEVFVDAPFETCEQRDVKGLYAKAQGGGVKNFTGLSSPYEKPEAPDLHLVTVGRSVEDSFAALRAFCQEKVSV